MQDRLRMSYGDTTSVSRKRCFSAILEILLGSRNSTHTHIDTLLNLPPSRRGNLDNLNVVFSC